jgi:hypothetical protein
MANENTTKRSNRRITSKVLDLVVQSIVANPTECRAYWQRCVDASAVRIADPTSPPSWLRNAKREHRIATAAVAHIDATGRATKGLTLAEAAEELGLPLDEK